MRLYVQQTGKTGQNAVYKFRVVDNGTGISEENRQRIFEAFEQAGTSSARSQGTGLGLAISRNIVQLMGGELKLKSESGEGSEFYFTIEIPVGDAAEAKGGKFRAGRKNCVLWIIKSFWLKIMT